MFCYNLSVFAAFIEFRLVACVFLNKMSVANESRRECSIDDEVDASRDEEEDNLKQTSTVTEKLKHATRLARVYVLCWVCSQIETCVSRAVRIYYLFILHSICELKHFDGIKFAKELPR